MKNSYFFLPGHHSNLGLIKIKRSIPRDSMILINKEDINESFQVDWNNLMFFRKPGTNEEWNKNWQLRKEAYYTHWTKDTPVNQIQLAFRNHWSLFNNFMKIFIK